jgi:hypothetical protein
MKTILSAVTALMIVVGSTAAFADSGDAPQTSQPAQLNTQIASATVASDVGNEIQPVFAGQSANVSLGGGLSAEGVNRIVQTANSAPIGFAG